MAGGGQLIHGGPRNLEPFNAICGRHGRVGFRAAGELVAGMRHLYVAAPGRDNGSGVGSRGTRQRGSERAGESAEIPRTAMVPRIGRSVGDFDRWRVSRTDPALSPRRI